MPREAASRGEEYRAGFGRVAASRAGARGLQIRGVIGWSRRRRPASVPRCRDRRSQFFFDRIHDPAPVRQTSRITGRVEFDRLLLRQVAAGAAMLRDQHSCDQIYVCFHEHCAISLQSARYDAATRSRRQ